MAAIGFDDDYRLLASNNPICQNWMSFDSWSIEDDRVYVGISIHKNERDLEKFNRDYWASMPEGVPEYYERLVDSRFNIKCSHEMKLWLQEQSTGIIILKRGLEYLARRKEIVLPHNHFMYSQEELFIPEKIKKRYKDITKTRLFKERVLDYNNYWKLEHKIDILDN